MPLEAVGCPVTRTILDPAVQNDPWDFYQELHDRCPVFPIPELGAVMITKHDDIRFVLSHPELFSNAGRASNGLQTDSARRHQAILRERGWGHVETLQRTDPPEHSRYRMLLNRVFTPRRVRDLAPRINEVAGELVDAFADSGRCEFVSQFALPLPGTIIAEQLGLDRNQVLTFKRWADAMLALATRVLTPAEVDEVAETELEAQHHLATEFERRREHPTDDLMSALVHAHGDDAEPFTMHELQNLMHQLVTGGFETTTNALNHAMLLLVQHPELHARIRADLSLVAPFVEEVLRYEGPVQGLARRTTRAVELRGVTIPADTMVIVRYGAANRDAEAFVHADVFDIDRPDVNNHLAFGHGPHYCVGASLARQQLISAFTVLVQRLDDIQFDVALPQPLHHPSLFFLPVREIRLRFTSR
jgi:cytochrome P450